eukprot:TRINITY_DN16728_c0_g1_i1.p1 TRINITY_DN16728_c0_g1~~TRINITY_DN16728_c0_g1_i1.p1  ORF type:complete len:1024 (+),score=160.24 TRINITY_DN16728_c0_g1_i1:83-3154(+)
MTDVFSNDDDSRTEMYDISLQSGMGDVSKPIYKMQLHPPSDESLSEREVRSSSGGLDSLLVPSESAADDSNEKVDTSAVTKPNEKSEIEMLMDEEETDLEPKSIMIGDLIRYITKDVQKSRQYQIFPFYLAFLIIFFVMLYVELINESEDLFYRDAGVRMQLRAAARDFVNDGDSKSEFHEVDTYEKYCDWLRNAITEVWPSLNGSPDPNMTWTGPTDSAPDKARVNIPLGFLLLRQFRVRPNSCPTSIAEKAMPSHWHANVQNQNCTQQYSRQTVSHEPFGPGNKWLSNIDKSKQLQYRGQFVNSVPLSGYVSDYDAPAKAFTEIFPVDQNVSIVIDYVNQLFTDRWIDEYTAAISLELVTYNQAYSNFVFTSLLVEKLPSGVYLPRVKSSSFHYLTDRWNIFTLDAISLIFIVYDFGYLVYRLKCDKDLLGPIRGFGIWGMFQCIMFGIFCAAYYYRVYLWVQSWSGVGTYTTHDIKKYLPVADPATANDTLLMRAVEIQMWYSMSQYAYLFQQWQTLVAGFYVMACLRSFSFAQYNVQLNILTETIRIAVGDLVGVVMCVAIIVLGFGFSCAMLYGHELSEFQSLISSAGTLLRTVLSGSLPQYQQMLTLNRWETRLLVLAYYVLSWLILMNMFLAVITGSFASVQDASQNQTSWRLSGLIGFFLRVIKRGGGGTPILTPEVLGKRNDEIRQRILMGEECTDVEIPESKFPEYAAFRKVYIKSRIRAVQALVNYTRTPHPSGTQPTEETRITESEFKTDILIKNLIPFSEESVARLYEKTAHEVSASNRSVNQGSMWAKNVSSKLSKIEDFLNNFRNSEIADATMRVPEALEVTHGINESLDDTKKQVAVIGDQISNLEKELTGASEASKTLTGTMSTVNKLSKNMESRVPETLSKMKDVLKYATDLEIQLSGISSKLDSWKGTMEEDIKRGTYFGAPTLDKLDQTIPRLRDVSKGSGIATSVSRYHYPTYYPTQDQDRPSEANSSTNPTRVTFGRHSHKEQSVPATGILKQTKGKQKTS